MNISGSGNLDFQIIDIEDHSLSIFKLKGLQLGFLITLYVIFDLITIGGESIIVFYIQKYSSKEQSINKMILIDQACC